MLAFLRVLNMSVLQHVLFLYWTVRCNQLESKKSNKCRLEALEGWYALQPSYIQPFTAQLLPAKGNLLQPSFQFLLTSAFTIFHLWENLEYIFLPLNFTGWNDLLRLQKHAYSASVASVLFLCTRVRLSLFTAQLHLTFYSSATSNVLQPSYI